MARSIIREEYMKARRALQRKISSYKKRGYTVPENYVPNIPKKVTEGSIRRLEKLFRGISERATYTTEKGEALTGKRAKVARQRETKREKARIKAEQRRQKTRKELEDEIVAEIDEMESRYDYAEENVIEEDDYNEQYIENYLDQFEGTAFGTVLDKTIKKLEGKISQDKLAQAFKDLESTNFAPNREARYDLDSAIMQVDAFLTNFGVFDMYDQFNLREAFSDDEMLMMGMEFERTREDYRNHQRAMRYANRKK